MKIAQIHWGFPPIIGGVETHLAILCPELVKMGHKVSLLTGSAEGYDAEYDFKGVKIYRSQFFDLNWLFRSGFQEVDDNVWEITSAFIEKTKPDVIHAHNMHYFCRFHTRCLEKIAIEKKIPLLVTAHNIWTDKLFLDLSTKVAWDEFISISEYISRELRAVGVPADKISNLSHGIDEKVFCPGKPPDSLFKKYPDLKFKKKRPVIFNPARMGLAKGCDISVEALRLVKEEFPDVLLLMSGSGNIIDWGLTQNKDIAFIVNLVKLLDLEENFHVQAFPLEDMPSLYKLSDVVIYPSSVEEPFGLATIESMATGKPIVVTDSGGMPETIKDGVTGFVVPKRNHEALAQKIIYLLKNPGEREKMGKAGRAEVEGFYTKAAIAERVVGAYHKAMKNYKNKKLSKDGSMMDYVSEGEHISGQRG
ncbi:MAG: glycosyltransferase family 4 protein [bacterium]